MSSRLEQAVPIHASGGSAEPQSGPQPRRPMTRSAIRSAVLLAAAMVLTMAGMALAYSVVRLLES